MVMGSGGETAQATAAFLAEKGEKVGVLRVRLYRPFPIEEFINSLPKSVKSIVVLDRTKEPGALGEPLYQDVVNALVEGNRQISRSLADVTGFLRRNSPLRWSKPRLTNCPSLNPRITSPSVSMTMSPTPASLWTLPSPSNTLKPCAVCSSVSAQMEPWARTRTRSRSSVKRPITMRKAISCTTRRNRVK
jgi:hypothetical protein